MEIVDGKFGAVAMGIHHGLFCIGCCWALMLILFAGGIMNLFLAAAIADFVLIEKISLAGRVTGQLMGGGAVTLGIAVIVPG